MRGQAGPVTEISVSEMNLFSYEQSSSVTGTDRFRQNDNFAFTT